MPLIAEVQARAIEELDYQLEAEAQRAFAAEFRDDHDIVVPDVVQESGTVLVTEWMESTGSLARVIREGTQEERDHYGLLFVRFLMDAPRRTGLLHADPHPGNFRTIPAADGSPGRLGVLDYGAVARLPDRELPRSLGALIRIALMEDYEQLVTALRDEGFVREKIRIDAEQLRAYLGPFLEPASVEEFQFSRSWMQGAVPPHQRPPWRRVRRDAAAEPAAGVHAHPPHLRRRRRRAQPARGEGAVPVGPARLAARLRATSARPPPAGSPR